MMFSVIIPTCNRNLLLGKCLDNLNSSIQQFNSINYEVIVTDDSANSVAENFIAQNYNWAQWVKGAHKGPAANRNNGVKHVKGKWLIFLDDDVLPDKLLLNAYKENIEIHPDILAFEGAIFPDNWDLLKKDLAECPVNTNGGCFWSANICIEKKLFESIGGFNEQFVIAAQEDQQLKIDVETKQQKIFFIEDAVVVHPVRFVTLKKKLKEIPLASKNFSLYAQKNKQVLGYTSVYRFVKEQSFIHLRNCFHQLKKLKPLNFLVALAWLIYGLPLNIINFSSLQKKKDAVADK